MREEKIEMGGGEVMGKEMEKKGVKKEEVKLRKGGIE